MWVSQDNNVLNKLTACNVHGIWPCKGVITLLVAITELFVMIARKGQILF